LNPRSPTNPGSDTGPSRYSFTSRWHLATDRDRVWEELDRLLTSDDPFVWWPGLRSRRGADDDIHVTASSPVGYRLRFRLHDLVETPRERVTLRSDGDLSGTATMDFAPVDAGHSIIDVTWDVEATPRWMHATERLLRPVFVLAHDAVMRRGERALNDWLTPNGGRGSRRRRRR
jgi:hypothetical protein